MFFTIFTLKIDVSPQYLCIFFSSIWENKINQFKFKYKLLKKFKK